MMILFLAASLLAATPAATEGELPQELIEKYSVPQRADFDAWLAEDVTRQSAYDDFVHMLDREGVSEVLEPWSLWNQGTSWKEANMARFAVPPRAMWPTIVPTLRVIRDRVVPLVGPVRVASGYRTHDFNVAAQGVKFSAHLGFGALDLLPVRAWRRDDLHTALLGMYDASAQSDRIGLGLYDGVRFHIDTRSKRHW
jgi:hypothetical protein